MKPIGRKKKEMYEWLNVVYLNPCLLYLLSGTVFFFTFVSIVLISIFNKTFNALDDQYIDYKLKKTYLKKSSTLFRGAY